MRSQAVSMCAAGMANRVDAVVVNDG